MRKMSNNGVSRELQHFAIDAEFRANARRIFGFIGIRGTGHDEQQDAEKYRE